MLSPESSTRAQPPLPLGGGGQPRLVMLQRPPGGATMRWPVRLGLLSSVWAPERDGQSLLSPAPLPRCSRGPAPHPLPLRLFHGSAPRPPAHTGQAEVGLVQVPEGRRLVFGRRGFGRRRRRCVFGRGWHLVHGTIVHAPGDALQSGDLNGEAGDDRWARCTHTFLLRSLWAGVT